MELEGRKGGRKEGREGGQGSCEGRVDGGFFVGLTDGYIGFWDCMPAIGKEGKTQDIMP